MLIARGYIMIESVIAGALLAVALGTTLSLIAAHRVEVSMAAKRAQASALAAAKADELMSGPHVTGSGTLVDPSHPAFTINFTVTNSGLEGRSVPPLADADVLHKISVSVTFPTSNGPQTVTHERLRRRFTP